MRVVMLSEIIHHFADLIARKPRLPPLLGGSEQERWAARIVGHMRAYARKYLGVDLLQGVGVASTRDSPVLMRGPES